MKSPFLLCRITLGIAAALLLMVALPVQAAPSSTALQMLEASKLVVSGQYPQAIGIYNQIIAAAPDSVDAYLHRAYAKRENGDNIGMQTDAQIVVRLANQLLLQSPNDSKLLYIRGNGYRLLKDFVAARQDILLAIQNSKRKNAQWQTDLQAIALEEKMSKQR